MDPWPIFNAVMAFIDPLVVFMVLVISEVIKRLIPADGVVGTSTLPPWVNRLMPMLPLVLGMVLICVKMKCLPNVDLMIKGLVSGAVAAYLYRTYKVMILGD